MISTPFRIARDYNRALSAPIRAAHIAWAGLGPVIAAPWQWSGQPRRALWARPALWAALATVFIFPFDGPLAAAIQSLNVYGDLELELRAWQQFGALGSLIFTAILIALLDPPRARRIPDLAAAAAVTWLMCQVLKIVIGRPRPGYDDPGILLGPFGAYPLGPEVGIRHAWEVWAGISSHLWSMPSSHTASAAALAIFLSVLYPRIKPVVVTLVVLVAFSRVLFDWHWPSDVAVGAAVGVMSGRAAVEHEWGQRLLARRALRTPALPPSAEPFPRAAPFGAPTPAATQADKERRSDRPNQANAGPLHSAP